MNERELRIGNFIKPKVKLNFADLKTPDIEVVNVIHLRDLEYYGSEKWAFEPIPLTEQWLLDFGFEKNDIGNYDKRMELSFDGRNYRFMQGWTNVKLKHVHKLQNLYFALTGEELELKK